MVLLSLAISGILAVIAGIIILIWPKSLNIAVGLYLLIAGILQLIAQYY